MRGKKSDVDFVSNFIIECAQNNKNSPDQILQEAKNKIDLIDFEIQKIEQLKIIRSKLLDVVNTFDNKKQSKDGEKSLELFQIKNHHICKYICVILKSKPVKVEEIKNSKYTTQDILFCIKQLIEYKVLSKTGNILLRGDKFEEYMKLVLQES
jgi:hypothetical protein